MVAIPIFKATKIKKNKRKFFLQDEDEEDQETTITFKKPPLNFEQKLQQLKESGGMGSFRYFKYDSRTREEKIMFEEALLKKMAKWKYDPSKLKFGVNENLLATLTFHWNKVVQLEKEIKEQILRQVMPTLTKKEVKDALKYHEARHTPKFRTF